MRAHLGVQAGRKGEEICHQQRKEYKKRKKKKETAHTTGNFPV
jgi:hypothetical protein